MVSAGKFRPLLCSHCMYIYTLPSPPLSPSPPPSPPLLLPLLPPPPLLPPLSSHTPGDSNGPSGATTGSGGAPVSTGNVYECVHTNLIPSLLHSWNRVWELHVIQLHLSARPACPCGRSVTYEWFCPYIFPLMWLNNKGHISLIPKSEPANSSPNCPNKEEREHSLI